MDTPVLINRLQLDGKFFLLDGERQWLKCVTYGPFPEPLPDHSIEFKKIKAAGFNAIRLYQPPSDHLLQAALDNDLVIFAGIPWQWNRIFLGAKDISYFHEAQIFFLAELKQWGNHPSIVALYIANEIPNDVIRWCGPENVRKALDTIILELRAHYPHLLYAYSSFPTTEFLEPVEADFTAFNIYLEEEKSYSDYVHHLHHVAGDRPLLISETGMDSSRNGEAKQAEVIQWLCQSSKEAGTAGITLFSWSDRWQNGGREITDWDFGITDRNGNAKPAYHSVKNAPLPITLKHTPLISIIVCVHNGASRVKPFLDTSHTFEYSNYEVIIIDDGSRDGLEELCLHYPHIRYVRQPHSGLSAARNLGAEHALGEVFAYTDDDCIPDTDWLFWIAKAYQEQAFDLCGGPNLPPEPWDDDEAVIAAAPGAPSHVMFTDRIAEHIPGCNLTVTREAFNTLGGFDTSYWVAGDDVDFCWKAQKQGMKIGFHGAAFVWHRRRATFLRYFKQQRGYGKAEALLLKNTPEKFGNNLEATWEGTIYQGGANSVQSGDIIYSGDFGMAAFQPLKNNVMPQRPLHKNFRSKTNLLKLAIAQLVHPYLRAFSRIHYSESTRKIPLYLSNLISLSKNKKQRKQPVQHSVEIESITHSNPNFKVEYLEAKLEEGWTMSDDPRWDIQHPDQHKILVCNQNIGGGLWNLRVKSLSQKEHY